MADDASSHQLGSFEQSAGAGIVALRHEQCSLWEGLFAEQVAELWELWLAVVEWLEGEELPDAVYEAQRKRHPHSRTRADSRRWRRWRCAC